MRAPHHPESSEWFWGIPGFVAPIRVRRSQPAPLVRELLGAGEVRDDAGSGQDTIRRGLRLAGGT